MPHPFFTRLRTQALEVHPWQPWVVVLKHGVRWLGTPLMFEVHSTCESSVRFSFFIICKYIIYIYIYICIDLLPLIFKGRTISFRPDFVGISFWQSETSHLSPNRSKDLAALEGTTAVVTATAPSRILLRKVSQFSQAFFSLPRSKNPEKLFRCRNWNIPT